MLTATMGWIGTAGTFTAYLLVGRGRLDASSLLYSSLNAVGGLLGGIACVACGAWPSVFSNAVWSAVGMYGVWSALRSGQVGPDGFTDDGPERLQHGQVGDGDPELDLFPSVLDVKYLTEAAQPMVQGAGFGD